ncbi:MAG: hypothetical protein WCA78_01495 [Rhizomicrobium sp.]
MSRQTDDEDRAEGAGLSSVPSHTPTHDLIRKARQYHRARFRTQFYFWFFVIFWSVICFPFVSWTMADPTGVACRSAGSCLFSIYGLLNAVPSAFLVLYLINDYRQDYYSHIDWKNAINMVGSLAKYEVVTEGFADFFDIYIRSKRRSYKLLALGLLGLTFGVVRATVMMHNGVGHHIFGIFVLAEIFSGLALLFLSFWIAQRYLPGYIVAENTLLLCTIALQKDINIPQAREIVAKDLRQFVERKPWWFYN